MTEADELAEIMAGLRREFEANALAEVEILKRACDALLAADDRNAQEGPLRKIEAICHGLAGRGGTFGYQRVTEITRPLELLAAKLLAARVPVDAAGIGPFADGFAALEAAVAG